jgi:acetyltransferase-like isoleucine patch superfamily enzyme
MQAEEKQKDKSLKRDYKTFFANEIESIFTYWTIKLLDCFGWTGIGAILRPKILRLLGFNIGKNVKFSTGIVFNRNRNNIFIDNCSRINSNVYFDPAGAYIKIGKYCEVGFNSVFACGTHKLKSDFKGCRGREVCSPIIIKDFVWVGCNVTVLGGVTIGEGSVIGAGSLVTHDVPPNVLAAGIPARIIKNID